MPFSSYVASLLLSANLLVANSPADQLRFCQDFTAEGLSQPAQSNRTLRLDQLGIQIDVPENFRAMDKGDSVSILAPEEYDYLRCMYENQVRTTPDATEVVMYQGELTSEALLRSQSGDRFGSQFLREAVIDNQPAFIYTQDGMRDGLVVRINYPDRQTSLIIWTPLVDGDQVPMQETLERILSTLTFL